MSFTKTRPDQTVARILIVDDHPAVREGLALRIARQPDMEVCGEAADVAEALSLSPAPGLMSPSSISPSRPATAST